MIRRAIDHLRHNRCCLLMVSLVATLAIAPSLDHVGARAFLAAFATSSFVFAVQAVGGGRRYALVAAALGAATLLLGTVVQLTGSPRWAIPALSVFVISGTFTLTRMLRYVLRPGEVTVDKIYAAISVYLLAGFSFGGVFAVTELVSPGSFEWAGAAAQQNPKTLLQSFVYLSFVTLVSLGYGDIIPVTPHARSLALIEALLGTFYMVVIIARLVSAFDEDSRHGRRDYPLD